MLSEKEKVIKSLENQQILIFLYIKIGRNIEKKLLR